MNKKSYLLKLFCFLISFSFILSNVFVYGDENGDPSQDNLNPVYTLAVTMFKKGKFERAKSLFKKISQEDPNYRLTSKYLQQIAEKESPSDTQTKAAQAEPVKQKDNDSYRKEILEAYKEGVYLFNIKKYVRAQERFETFLKAYPGEKHAVEYLGKIKQAIAEKNKKLDVSMKNYASMAEEERLKEQRKQERKAYIEERKAVEQEQIRQRRLASLYRIAKRDYRRKRYAKAEEYFRRILSMDDDYKSTNKYLEAINDVMIKKREALQEKINKEFAQELEMRRLMQEHKQEVIAKEDSSKQDQEDKDDARDLYAQAKDLYRSKRYEQAKAKFQEVEMLSPGYRSAVRYISKINRIQAQEEEVCKMKLAKMSETSNANEIKSEKAVSEIKVPTDLGFGESDAYIKALEKKIEMTRKKILNAESGVDEELDLPEQKASESKSDRLYFSAVEKYNNKEYSSAEKDFKAVERMSPDYKATRSYLMMIDAQMERQEEKIAENQKVEEAYEKAVRFYNNRKYEEALSHFIALSKTNPQYKDLPEYIKKTNRALSSIEEKEKERLAMAIYKDAIKLYKSKQYQLAQEKFLAVNDLILDFKSTDRYLKKIQKRITSRSVEMARDTYQQQPQRRIVKNAPLIISNDDQIINQAVEKREKDILHKADQKYRSALAFYNNENFIEAKRKFIEVEALYPGYKDTLSFLQHIDDDIVQANLRGVKQGVQKSKKSWVPNIFEKNLEESQQTAFQDEAQDVYNQALNYYRQRDYERAQAKFEEVQVLIPDYEKTEKYLKKIAKRISIQKRREAKNRTNVKSAERRQSPEIDEVKEAKHPEEIIAAKKIEEFKQRQQPETDMSRQSRISPRTRRKADKLMDKALEYYREGDYKKARKVFVKVDKMIPQYKSSRRYIVTLDKMIFEKDMEEKLAKKQEEMKTHPQERLKSYHEDKLVEIYKNKTNNEKVIRDEAKKDREMLKEQRVLLNKEEAKLLKDQIERREKLEARKEKEKKQMQKRILSQKYKEGIKYYRQRRFSMAKQRFNEIRMIDPTFKSTRNYLKKIDTKVEDAQKFLIERMLEKKKLDSKAPQNIDPTDVNFEKKNKEYNREAVKEIIETEVPVDEQPLYEYSKKDALAFLEAKESLNYRKEWDRKKREIKRLQKLEEKRKAEAIRELEKKLAKQKAEREEQLAKEKEAMRKDAEAQVDEAFEEALRLYKEKEAGEYLNKAQKLYSLLDNELFDQEYVESIKRDFDKEKLDIQAIHEKEREQREAQLKKEEEELAKRKKEIEEKRLENLEKLEQKIKVEEQRIADERQKEQERIQKAEMRDEKMRQSEHDLRTSYASRRKELDAKITRRKRTSSASIDVDVDYVHPLLEEVKESQVSRKKELSRSMERKTRAYEKEKREIDRDLKTTLAALYERAVKLFNEKSYFDASRIFSEIQKMAPTYRNTDDYLRKSHQKMSSSMNRSGSQPGVYQSKKAFELPAVMVYPE